MTFEPGDRKEDRRKAEKWLRRRSNGELIQVIAAPRSLAGWLPGFSLAHHETAAEQIVVELAKGELHRRGDRSGKALAVSIVSIIVALLSFGWTVLFSFHAFRRLFPWQ